MKKKLFPILLALVLCLALLPAAWATTTTNADTADALTSAVASGGSIKLTADITLSSTLEISTTVTLDLNGHVLSLSADTGSVIKVAAGGKLTLTDSNTDNLTHKFTVDSSTGLWSLCTETGCSHEHKTVTGGVITGGKGTQSGDYIYGGGVYMAGESGKPTTFNMTGGTICGNTAEHSSGGVYVNDYCTFTMSDGTICGNTASNATVSSGGGVGLYGGNFTMSGGTIADNTAYHGGGVCVYSSYSTFTMSNNSTITGNTAQYGGGVSVFYGKFIMNGGSITGNNGTSTSTGGGGVYVDSTGTFTMTGGSITGNNSNYNGGGVHVYSGTFKVKGNVTINANCKNGTKNTISGVYESGTASNVYLVSNITVTGALGNTASIGVTTWKTPKETEPVQFAVGTNSHSITESDMSAFTPDNNDYKVVLDGENNALKLAKKTHEHSWNYTLSEDGKTINATCVGDIGTCGAENKAITIAAPDSASLTYDGTEKKATVSGSIDGVDTPLIGYERESEGGYVSAPAKNAGKYRASITLTGANGQTVTASVTYTIARKQVTVRTQNITVDDVPKTYGGSAHTPSVTIVLEDDTPIPNSEYTLEYSNNTDAGEATVTIKDNGSGNYQFADATAKFAINPAVLTVTTAPVSVSTLTYNGEDRELIGTPGILADPTSGTFEYSLGNSTAPDGNWSTALPTGKDKGEYFVWWRVISNNPNYKNVDATSCASVKIDPANIALTKDPTALNLTYTGSEQNLVTPGTITKGSGKFWYRLGGSGTWSTDIPMAIAVGYDYKIWWYVESTDPNYSDRGSESNCYPITATIGPASLTDVFVTQNGTLTYNGTEQTAAVTTSAHTVDNTDNAITFTYSTNEFVNYTSDVPKFKEVGTHKVYFKASAPNHGTTSGSFDVTIDPATPSVTGATATVTYGTAVDGNDINATTGGVSGTFTWRSDVTSYGDVGTCTLYATFTPADTTNYNVVENVEVRVTVTQKSYSDQTATGSAKYGNTGTVELGGFMVSGGTLSNVYYTTDADTVLTNVTLNGTTLSFTFADDSGKVGKDATVKLTVSSRNHQNYDITVTLTVSDKESPTVTANAIVKPYTGSSLTDDVITGDSHGVAGTWRWKGGNAPTDVADSTANNKTWYVVFTPDDTTQYKPVETAVTVTITPAEPNIDRVPSPMTLTYDGQDQALLSDGGSTGDGTFYYSLDSGDNKTWSTRFPTAKDAGSYTVYYYVAGDANHTDSAPAGVIATIRPRNLTQQLAAESPLVFFTQQGSLTFNGSAQTPTFKLELKTRGDNGTQSTSIEELVKGTDYEVSVTPQTNAGERYEITFIGKGNYTGTKTVTWSIAKADLPAASYPADLIGSKGNALSSVTLPNGWTWVDGTQLMNAAGDQTFAANYAGTGNYNEKSGVMLTVNVSDKTPMALTVTMDGWTYGDAANAPSYTTAIGAGTPVVRYKAKGADDFTYRGIVPTDAGDYTVRVSYETATEIWSGTADFAIAKATPTGAPVYTAITTSGKTLADASLTTEGGTFSVPGTVKWVDDEGSELPADTAVASNTAYKWVFTPDDSANYNAIEGSVTLWSYTPAPVIPVLPITPPAETVTVPVSSDHASVEVKVEVSDGNVTVAVSDDELEQVAADGAGVVTVDVSGLDDVDSATIPARVVEKADEAENTGLSVALPAGSVTLDETALGSVTENADGADVTISVVAILTEKLPPVVKEIIGMKPTVAAVVDVNILVNGQKQSQFSGGKITVSIPYTPKPGEDTSKLTVWFIRDDGTIENKGGRYDAERGCFVFETEHLSQYLLVNPNEAISFTDVPEDAYYADAVNWSVQKGIAFGTGDGLFDPGASCTRAQIVTFLWRAAGQPVVDYAMPFTDVEEDDYFCEAVRWAAGVGIVKGTSATTFDPNGTCTRAQAVTFLFRYAAANGMDAMTLQELVSGHGDAAQVPGYALSAFNWALAKGIVQGANGNLMPDNDCTRAQIVTMLYRLLGE